MATPQVFNYFFKPVKYDPKAKSIVFTSDLPTHHTWYEMYFSECMNICEGHYATPGFILDYMGSFSFQIVKHEITNLIMNCPPGCSKTVWGAVLATLYLGCYPNERITIISSTEAVRDKYRQFITMIINSSFYKYWFPNTFVNETRANNKSEVSIGDYQGCVRMFAIGADITGVDSEFCLVDDPIDSNTFKKQGPKYLDDVNAKFSYLQTRLRKKNKDSITPMVLIMQRIGKGDTTDFALNSMRFMKWVQVKIPAIETSKNDTYNGTDPNLLHKQGKYYITPYVKWFRPTGTVYHPERLTIEEIEGKRDAFSSEEEYLYQYQQDYSGEGNNQYINIGAIRRWDSLEGISFEFYIMAVDTAIGVSPEDETRSKQDFNCAVVMGVTKAREIYLVDCELNRCKYESGGAKAKYMALIEKYNPKHILIEEANTGITLLEDVKGLLGGQIQKEFKPNYRIIRLVPRKENSKVENAIVANSIIEQGLFHLPEDEKAFNKRYLYRGKTDYVINEIIRELVNFPDPKIHDDVVDAITTSLCAIKKMYMATPRRQVRISII